ncbi:MAG TPA: cyclic nucleotide-binding domain-containing protein, partial [Alkalispirochaeta sp.]|nr:cyclic nucleotide-binding domain-containing protein [Alkalispirochaeta sp.]
MSTDRSHQPEILTKLQQIPIFEAISENEQFLQELVGICRLKSYRAGDLIIREGDVGDSMFVVYSGAVEIKKRTRAGDDYTVVQLR